jgi:hypothetical protein
MPWAPLLILAATEPLACNIRLSQIGLSLPEGLLSYKGYADGYADDTCYYLANLSHIRKLLQLFNDYKEVSGLKVNESKSSVIPLGTSMGMVVWQSLLTFLANGFFQVTTKDYLVFKWEASTATMLHGTKWLKSCINQFANGYLDT